MGSDDDPDDFNILMSNPQDTVGVVTFNEERHGEIPKTTIQTEYLRDLVGMAESLDWEHVVVGLDDDYPVFIEHEEDTRPGSIVAAPFTPDGEEDDDGN